jgi:hypothetical protein
LQGPETAQDPKQRNQLQVTRQDADPRHHAGVRSILGKLIRAKSVVGRAVSVTGRARFRRFQPILKAPAWALVALIKSSLSILVIGITDAYPTDKNTPATSN